VSEINVSAETSIKSMGIKTAEQNNFSTGRIFYILSFIESHRFDSFYLLTP